VRVLLDTHALFFWWSAPERLPGRVVSLLRDPGNECLVSAASGWEMATKHRIGKFPQGGRIVEQWEERRRKTVSASFPSQLVTPSRLGLFPANTGPHSTGRWLRRGCLNRFR